jgi:hypothetical protein
MIFILQKEINTMETQIEEKKKQIEERTPLFEELERVFEERTNAYNAMKKNIASMWYCGHSTRQPMAAYYILFYRRRISKTWQLLVN